MNKITPKQLHSINIRITKNASPLAESRKETLDLVVGAPYEQNENLYYKYKTLSAKAAKFGCEIA